MFSLNLNRIKNFFGEVYCNVGFIDSPEGTVPAHTSPRINWLKHKYKEGWFADPFILDVCDGQITILVEDYVYKQKKGRLDLLTIDRSTFELKRMDVVLELDSHLSFPAIFREAGKIYVYPENYQGGALKIYEYDCVTRRLIKPHVLIGEPLLDAVCRKIGAFYYLFAVKFTGSLETGKTIFIYRAEKLLGNYQLFQQMDLGTSVGRAAGDIFEQDGTLIRPTQDCEGGYGLAVIFNRLLLRDGSFRQEEITRLRPRKGLLSNGLHTFNAYQDIAAVDGLGLRRGFFARVLTNLYKSYRTKC